MRYLLINHVPCADGQEVGRIRLGELWLEDLRAQARAVAEQGGRLTVATPQVRELDPARSGSFHLVEVHPGEHGFDHYPLPYFTNMREFLQQRRRLQHRLRIALGRADVAQMGYGGHPVALGQVAWPIASELRVKRIWVFDGADPFPRLQRTVGMEANPLKRWVRRRMADRFERFCREAVGEADLVFSHNAAIRARFRQQWGPHCHEFRRSFVTEEIILNDQQVEQREAHLRDTSRPMRVANAGRQIRIKGTDQLIEAVKVARQRGARIEMDVFGDGEDLGAFRQQARELGMEKVVQFYGPLRYGKELFEALDETHLLAVTNLTDELSRNLLIGAARGIPLVAYQNPGADPMLREHDAAELVPREDVHALGEALVRLDADRQRLVTLMHHGLDMARRYSMEAVHRERAELAAALVGSGVKVES